MELRRGHKIAGVKEKAQKEAEKGVRQKGAKRAEESEGYNGRTDESEYRGRPFGKHDKGCSDCDENAAVYVSSVILISGNLASRSGKLDAGDMDKSVYGGACSSVKDTDSGHQS